MFEGFEVNENTTWEDLLNFVRENYEGCKGYREFDMIVRNNTIYIGIVNLEVKFSKKDFLILQDSMGNWHMSLENEGAKVFCR